MLSLISVGKFSFCVFIQLLTQLFFYFTRLRYLKECIFKIPLWLISALFGPTYWGKKKTRTWADEQGCAIGSGQIRSNTVGSGYIRSDPVKSGRIRLNLVGSG